MRLLTRCESVLRENACSETYITREAVSCPTSVRYPDPRPNAANNVAHSNNKSKRRQLPNLQRKRIWVPKLGRFVRIRVTTRVLRSIDRVGLEETLEKNGLRLEDIS